MASIYLGNFKGHKSSGYGQYECYLDYNLYRSGNNLVLGDATVNMYRQGTGYTTNRIAIKAGYNGSNNNLKDNVTLNKSGTNSPATISVSLGSPSIATNGNFSIYIAIASTGGSSTWGNFQTTPLESSQSISGIAPSAPTVPGGVVVSLLTPKPADNFTFSWNASSGGTNGVTGYRVDVKVGDGAWQEGKFWPGTTRSITTNGNALGAGHNTVVSFRVVSFSKVNNVDYVSGVSSSATTTIKVPVPTINKPTLDMKSQTQIKVSVVGTVNAGLSLSGYQFSKDNGATWTSIQTGASYTFSGLNSYQEYEIVARIVDTGNQTATSSKLTVRTNPTYPSIQKLETSNVTDVSIKLTATATAQAGISKYQFSKDNGTTWTTKQDSNEYVFSGLIPYTNYTFKVKVIDTENFDNETSVIKRTMASKPTVSNIVILELTDEIIRVETNIIVPSISLKKIEFKIDNGPWTTPETENLSLKKGTKKYVDLIEETEYNISVRAYNSEDTVSDVLAIPITTLPGKFVTIIRDGEVPKKIHTYLVKPNGDVVKLTKRTFNIIK